MAFVNEVVPEGDIDKHQIDELIAELNSFSWAQGRPAGFKHSWTIDRSRDAYLVHVKQENTDGASGRNEPGSIHTFALIVNGLRWLIRVDKTGTSSSIRENPFLVKYKLLEISCPDGHEAEQQTILSICKEALIAYGFWGAWMQVDNTIVEFCEWEKRS